MEVRRRLARAVPNNPFNLAGEWSTGSENQQHTLSVNGAYQLKWDFN